ncbi:hypothetical protein Pst134EB_024049 [Puccinia striiformis f. sp. tritici]|nr:hypothetical protein Pst134EB_024049 [Puccinia striiformis f. sp. tritici]
MKWSSSGSSSSSKGSLEENPRSTSPPLSLWTESSSDSARPLSPVENLRLWAKVLIGEGEADNPIGLNELLNEVVVVTGVEGG